MFNLVKEEFSEKDQEKQWAYDVNCEIVLNKIKISQIIITDHYQEKHNDAITNELILEILLPYKKIFAVFLTKYNYAVIQKNSQKRKFNFCRVIVRLNGERLKSEESPNSKTKYYRWEIIHKDKPYRLIFWNDKSDSSIFWIRNCFRIKLKHLKRISKKEDQEEQIELKKSTLNFPSYFRKVNQLLKKNALPLFLIGTFWDARINSYTVDNSYYLNHNVTSLFNQNWVDQAWRENDFSYPVWTLPSFSLHEQKIDNYLWDFSYVKDLEDNKKQKNSELEQNYYAYSQELNKTCQVPLILQNPQWEICSFLKK